MPKSIQEAIQREQRIQQLVQKFHLEDDEYDEAAEVQQVVQNYSQNRYNPSMEYSYE